MGLYSPIALLCVIVDAIGRPLLWRRRTKRKGRR